jgi:hypothetical protein
VDRTDTVIDHLTPVNRSVIIVVRVVWTVAGLFLEPVNPILLDTKKHLIR